MPVRHLCAIALHQIVLSLNTLAWWPTGREKVCLYHIFCCLQPTLPIPLASPASPSCSECWQVPPTLITFPHVLPPPPLPLLQPIVPGACEDSLGISLHMPFKHTRFSSTTSSHPLSQTHSEPVLPPSTTPATPCLSCSPSCQVHVRTA